MSASPGTGRPDLDALAELEEQRDFLLRSLDDLEREWVAGDLDDADYEALKDDYTVRAAAVLRAIEEGGGAPTPAAARPRRGRRAVAVVVVAGMALSAGLAVAGSSGSRLPGETLTGDIRQTTSARLEEAAQLASAGEVAEALDVYDRILADDPDNLEALSERGLLLVSVGSATGRATLAEQGRASIERALALDPDNPRVLFYRGLALRLAGEDEEAAAAFAAALANDPPPLLREQIQSFLASAGERPPPGESPPGG